MWIQRLTHAHAVFAALAIVGQFSGSPESGRYLVIPVIVALVIHTYIQASELRAALTAMDSASGGGYQRTPRSRHQIAIPVTAAIDDPTAAIKPVQSIPPTVAEPPRAVRRFHRHPYPGHRPGI